MSNITIKINGPKETRDRRVSAAIKQSTYQNVAKIASVTKLSVNDLINQALEQLVNANVTLVNQYDEEHKEL